jgi:predicted transcriptional regulator
MNEPFRYNDDALVDAETINAYIEELEEVKLERDALWVKTQEDEREINDLRDANNELRQWKEEALKVMNQWNEVSDYINFNAEVEDLGRFVPQICLKYLKERDEMKRVEEQRDEAIRLATLFQTLYLRLGKAEDEHYNTLMVQGAAKSLAELKGLKFFGKEA